MSTFKDNYEKSDNERKLIIFIETLFIFSKYYKIKESLNLLESIDDNKLEEDMFSKIKDDFERNFKSEFLNKYYYFARIGKAFGKIITMIYFCLIIILTAFTGTSMMFYACLKRQGYLSIFMHVFWNIMRFFMFSFFIYGAAFGMCYLALRDAVAYVMYVFGEENLKHHAYLLPKGEGKAYLSYCLLDDNNDYKNKLDRNLLDAIENYFNSYSELTTFMNSIKHDESDLNDLIKSQNSIICEIKTNLNKLNEYHKTKDNTDFDFPEVATRKGGIFGSFDCSFLKSNLAMTYRTIYDLAIEARILCALSCCIAFFGAVFVYFFLLVMHHYDTELFPEHKKAIFTGFDGFGNTKKKSFNDPQHKKRKLRAEVELSSRNEEYSGFQHGNND